MDKDYGFGGWGIVILIALFFLLFAGRGFGGPEAKIAGYYHGIVEPRLERD